MSSNLILYLADWKISCLNTLKKYYKKFYRKFYKSSIKILLQNIHLIYSYKICSSIALMKFCIRSLGFKFLDVK